MSCKTHLSSGWETFDTGAWSIFHLWTGSLLAWGTARGISLKETKKRSVSPPGRLWSDRKTIGNERFCSVVTKSFFLLCSRGMLLKIGVRLAVISQCLEINLYKFSHVVAPHFIGLVLAPGALETLLKKEPRPFFKAGVPCSNKSQNALNTHSLGWPPLVGPLNTMKHTTTETRNSLLRIENHFSTNSCKGSQTKELSLGDRQKQRLA